METVRNECVVYFDRNKEQLTDFIQKQGGNVVYSSDKNKYLIFYCDKDRREFIKKLLIQQRRISDFSLSFTFDDNYNF
jgi:uncharacterized protein YlbG (UPF0298 family)